MTLGREGLRFPQNQHKRIPDPPSPKSETCVAHPHSSPGMDLQYKSHFVSCSAALWFL